MAYRIEIKKSAAKELAALAKRDQRRIAAVISALADNPRPPGGRKLTGTEDAYRVRVGDYRIVYQIVDAAVVVYIIRIGHRKDIYRKL
ncbi:MAG: type II toxin-antitoxin system RelE/ParE family toxin [Phycisphaerae bacterium]|nr:type II toxin-antitoxin system RelE/ParE family toxin [Phycisphaerae bacterium]